MIRCLLRGSQYATNHYLFAHETVSLYRHVSIKYTYAKSEPVNAYFNTRIACRCLHIFSTSPGESNFVNDYYSDTNIDKKPQHRPRKLIGIYKAETNSSYFRSTDVPTRDIEKILTDPALAAEILDKIYSGRLSVQDTQAMQSLVVSAIDWATSTYSDAAYNFLIDAWHIVFFQCRKLELLQPIRSTFTEKQDHIIHIMLNRGDSAAYLQLVEPLIAMQPVSCRSWAMIAMETLQPSALGNVYRYDMSRFKVFLQSQHYSREQKHKMVALLITKSLIYSDSPNNVDSALTALIEGVRLIDDAVFVDKSQYFHVYKRALTMFGKTDSGTAAEAKIERMCDIVFHKVSLAEASDLLSAISRASAEIYPHFALRSWELKNDILEGTKKPAYFSRQPTEHRSQSDLTSAMLASIKLRAYDQALALYATNVSFQDDAQIALLLRSSECTKDWKLLQNQFEDMYGRGNLPYVVHYSVVMGALASIGATREVEQLYAQLLKRELIPTSSIFLALVQSNVNALQVDGAEKWFRVFLEFVKKGVISPSHVPQLQLEIFRSRLSSMSVSRAMAEFEELAQKQENSSIPFLNSFTIRSLLRFMSSMYSMEGFETVWRIAEKFNLADDAVFSEALTFLTKMGHFQRADDLAFHAQIESPVPMQNSLILAHQLRNFRQWRKEITDSQTKKILTERIYGIINKAKQNQASPRHLGSLLVEIIKHYTSMRKPDLARPYLDKANALNISTERHFVPFLKEYSTEGSYDDNSDVLALYREMVARKTTITARTYYYLSKSLFMIDAANNNGHGNSLDLLQSVLEMYGFSVMDGHATTKVSVSELSKNAVFLLQIVAQYAIEASGHDDSTMNLVLNFLKQIRAKLDKNIDYAFRVSILTEMSKVYRVYGNLQVAGSLVDSALKEMDGILGQLPSHDPVPKLLQLDYRKTFDIKMSVLSQTNAPSSEYVSLLRRVLHNNVRLSGPQFYGLHVRVLGSNPTKENVQMALESCERFLVSGNWAETKINRKIHYIYKLYLVYLGRTMSPEAIANRYDILNKLYDIKDVSAILREFQYIHSPFHELEQAMKEFYVLYPKERWSADRLLENLAEFFTPERTFDTRHIIQPNLAAVLVKSIETICDGDQAFAFQLYNEYPETMEFLLFFVGERTRVVNFRKAINKLQGSNSVVAVEGRNARRQQSVEVLKSLWGQ